VWWQLLSETEPDEVCLEKIRALFAGKIQGKELLELLRKADERRQPRWQPAAGVVLAQVQGCLAAGRRDLARTRLKQWLQTPTNPDNSDEAPQTSEPFLLLADLCAGDKEWAEAARWYRRAWQQEPRDPWPFYAHGRALIQAGQEKEGRRCLELAPLLPLGDTKLRCQFARHLLEAGERDATLREDNLALKLGTREEPSDNTVALVHLARAATIKGDFRAAAAYHERVRLVNLDWNLGRVRTGLYLVLSHRVHHQQARAALTAGRLEDARKEIRLCQTLLPGNIDLPIAVVPELEAKGLKKDADQLFQSVFDVHAGLCADYPRCDWAHHNLAWLAVRCGRRLDTALEHARTAAGLAPKNPLYLDTLAEVYFQRGDKEKSGELLKKCVELEPSTVYFRKQLQRVAAGDPRAALPAEIHDLHKSDEACLLPKDVLSHGGIIKGPFLIRGGGSVNNGVESYDP
jgi:tetratricopeptide (TPR) repeat protein